MYLGFLTGGTGSLHAGGAVGPCLSAGKQDGQCSTGWGYNQVRKGFLFGTHWLHITAHTIISYYITNVLLILSYLDMELCIHCML